MHVGWKVHSWHCNFIFGNKYVLNKCINAFESVLVAQSCPTFCDAMDCNLLFLCPWDSSPGKNTGVGYHAFLQGIFLTQGSNPDLLHCRQILYCCTTGEATGCSKSSSILPCWGSHSKYTGVTCHSLLQWIPFCQNSPLWPVHPGQPPWHGS